MTRSIEGTTILGSNKIIIHPIMPYQSNDEEHTDFTYALNLDFMGKLTKVAKEYGVIICFENMPMPNLSLGSVEATLDLVKTPWNHTDLEFRTNCENMRK